MVAGVLGVPLGSYLSQTYKKRIPTIDPILCAGGLIISVPFLTGAMLIVSQHKYTSYALCFFGQLALNINWAIVADILLVRIHSLNYFLHIIFDVKTNKKMQFSVFISQFFFLLLKYFCCHFFPVCLFVLWLFICLFLKFLC